MANNSPNWQFPEPQLTGTDSSATGASSGEGKN